MIDDRVQNKSSKASSITKYITVYRLRPLTDRIPNTTYIVDTPVYGDTEGLHRDRFTTDAMRCLFSRIKHINAVIFTSVSNKTRATAGLRAVQEHVFELFDKDVFHCLRTIITFSDAAKPEALIVLEDLQWPVKNGYVRVNNAAFKVTDTEEKGSPNLKRWWDMSMLGQYELMTMLRTMPCIPTVKSMQVTKKKKILY